MLKIERNKDSLDLKFRLQKRSFFLSPSFCKAFGLALCLHLLGIILFSVPKLKIRDGDSNPLFTHVVADISNLEHPARLQLSLQRENSKTPLAYIANIAPSKPYLWQSFSIQNGIKEYSFFHEFAPTLPLFTELEKPFLEHEIPVKYPFFGKLLNLKTFKELSQYEIVCMNSQALEDSISNFENPIFEEFIFDVICESSTGNLFFIEPKNLSEDSKLNKLILQFIKELRFEKSGKHLTQGTLQLTIGVKPCFNSLTSLEVKK